MMHSRRVLVMLVLCLVHHFFAFSGRECSSALIHYGEVLFHGKSAALLAMLTCGAGDLTNLQGFFNLFQTRV